MTDLDRQNLISEKNGLKTDLIFNEEYGAAVVADYVAQKEAGETPTIDISNVNAKRKQIRNKIQEIENVESGVSLSVSIFLMNCSHSGRTGIIKHIFNKEDIELESLRIDNIVGNNLRDPVIKLDGVLLVKDVDYTFANNSLRATQEGYNKAISTESRTANIEIVGE